MSHVSNFSGFGSGWSGLSLGVSLGICTIDAGGDGSIPDLAKLYHDLGKRTFAICDKQTDAKTTLIEAQVEQL